MATRRKPRRTPQETLSLDWFSDIPDFHTVESPLTTPRVVEASKGCDNNKCTSSTTTGVESVESVENVSKKEPPGVENRLKKDPLGCHSNVEEHRAGVENCAATLRGFGVDNPRRFLERWSTSQVLTALDALVGQMRGGNTICRPSGWLWTYLNRATGLEGESDA